MRKSPLANEDKPANWAPRGGTSGGHERQPDRMDANSTGDPAPSEINTHKPTGGSSGRKGYPNLAD